MIEVKDLSKIYSTGFRKYQALDTVSFTVELGVTLGVIGVNGAGKTTLMKHLLGFLKPTSGTISVMDASPGSFEVKKQLGFLPENIALYKYLSCKEFLHFIGEIFEMTPGEIETRSHELLSAVGLENHASKHISSLSKGMRQRLGLAQALLPAPKVLLLDEPMTGLDPLGRRMLIDVLQAEKQKGTTIVLNSHILSDIERLCDQVIILDKGKILGQYSVGQLKEMGGVEHYFCEAVTSS